MKFSFIKTTYKIPKSYKILINVKQQKLKKSLLFALRKQKSAQKTEDMHLEHKKGEKIKSL